MAGAATSMPTTRRVLVTDAGSVTGGVVSRLLRERGLEVLTAALPSPDDPSFSWSLTRAVREVGAGLLVPTLRAQVPFVAAAVPALKALSCSAFVPRPYAARTANDLLHAYEALRAAGVDVPRFACGISRRQVPGLLPFPLLSRARLDLEGTDIVAYERLEELPESLSVGRVCHETFWGAGYDVVLFGEGKAEPITLVVLASGAGQGDASAHREHLVMPDVALVAGAASEALEIRGPALIRVRRDRHERPRVVDVEARPPAALASATEVIDTLLDEWRLSA